MLKEAANFTGPKELQEKRSSAHSEFAKCWAVYQVLFFNLISSGSWEALNLMGASMHDSNDTVTKNSQSTISLCDSIQEGRAESTVKNQEYEGPLSHLRVTRRSLWGTLLPDSQSMELSWGSFPSSRKQIIILLWTMDLVLSFSPSNWLKGAYMVSFSLIRPQGSYWKRLFLLDLNLEGDRTRAVSRKPSCHRVEPEKQATTEESRAEGEKSKERPGVTICGPGSNCSWSQIPWSLQLCEPACSLFGWRQFELCFCFWHMT